jgi:hypothetical protein
VARPPGCTSVLLSFKRQLGQPVIGADVALDPAREADVAIHDD